MNNVYQVQDNFIDLSKVKTFRLGAYNTQKPEKRRLVIELKDEVIFLNGRNSDDGMEVIPQSIEIVFDDERDARSWSANLVAAWEYHIEVNNGR